MTILVNRGVQVSHFLAILAIKPPECVLNIINFGTIVEPLLCDE